ncbi:hypothetical protein MSAN_01028800 [Mycena sanguinolenta]|uniref:F-box domain-containing protein n=1 Tax=Mycena sanguinolenta TaxID=230812 RepID=A0A8H6YTQ5_9AGAR|nr:hypothetical protein MSAN_01028800 [Mycena sanguinolenta]
MSLQSKSGEFKPADSPFVGLFEQNRSPSLDERKTILGLVAEKTAHLAQLNSQVPKRRPGKKHKIPRELRVQLAETRRWLEFHRALISPWRQLPTEILSEIFLFTLNYRGDFDADEPWNDDRAGTLRLCRICAAWRVIALRTPALWNTLSVRLLDPQGPLEWVSIWLARSRSIPVYLQLLWDSEALPEDINSVMSVFASHLHHTAELAIDGLYFCGESTGEEYPKLTFRPSVESLNAPFLSAVNVHLPEGSEWDWINAACRASPCLTHLTTSHSSLDLFPVANLTELNWSRWAPTPMSQVFQVLEDAPNLRHIDINVAGPVVASSAQSRLTMKSIAKLQIASYEHLGEFLEQVEFPSVVNLCISFADEWPGPPFHSFLSRSSCALSVLVFRECGISPAEIVACLRHSACNMLEQLSVQDCEPEDGDVLLQHLTYQGPEHSPCSNPNLRTILLFGIRCTDGLLSTMVESRCSTTFPSGPPGPAQLTMFWFSFVDMDTESSTHPIDWKRLRELKKMKGPGLNIGWL